MTSTSSTQALAGLRVIDVSTFIAGLCCAAQLGEFVAEVIKPELPGGGSLLKKFGTMTECGDSLPWLSEARNKKSITLDLRKASVGQDIDIGLCGAISRVLNTFVPAFHRGSLMREGMGRRAVNVFAHNHCQTVDEKWLAIARTSNKIFKRLAQAMGQSEHASSEHSVLVKQRQAQRSYVDGYVANWTRFKKRHEMIDICEQTPVPCGPVHRIDEIFDVPQYATRTKTLDLSSHRSSEQTIPNVVPRLSETQGKVSSVGQAFGAQNT